MSEPHIDIGTLADYWIGQTDDAATQAIDEHLLGCDACGARLDAVIALAAGVRRAFGEGRVPAYMSERLVSWLVERGVRVREYRVPHNGSVHCSVAPQDEFLLSRYEVPLAGVRRVDAVYTVGGEEERRPDVPFDAASGEVLFAPDLSMIRRAPAMDVHVRLLAVDDAGSREIGRYTMHHRPWTDRPS